MNSDTLPGFGVDEPRPPRKQQAGYLSWLAQLNYKTFTFWGLADGTPALLKERANYPADTVEIVWLVRHASPQRGLIIRALISIETGAILASDEFVRA